MTATCPDCGRSEPIYAHDRCRPCYARSYREVRRILAGKTDETEDDAALTGGRWVLDRRRRVQVWMPDPVVLGGAA